MSQLDQLDASARAMGANIAALRHSITALLAASTGEPLWSVIEQGEQRAAPASEVDVLVRTSAADFILHVPDGRLRYRPMLGSKRAAPQWRPLSFVDGRIFKLGLTRPGSPFGDLSYNRVSRGRSVKARSLTRYVARITRWLQGGGTGGPYLISVSGVSHVSSTGRGYRFDERWRCMVVEGPVQANLR